jgi:maleate isomerase
VTYDRDYGALGRIGIIAPQSNPTVEPEIGLLLPARVSMVVARSVSSGEPRQRLQEYFEQLDGTLQRFDTMPLDAVGFACTGSSYLVGHDAEQRALEGLESRFGYPVVSAAQALDAALKHLGAKRIALACPYPEWLLEAARRFWTERGYEIVTGGSVQPQSGDTRSIYALQGAAAGGVIRSMFEGVEADVFLITGTGMPSLRLVSELTEERHRPVLNSNLCLAWHCLQRAGIAANERGPSKDFPLLGGWKAAVDRL